MRDGMAMSDRPGNVKCAALETSSVNYYNNATGYLAQPRGETNLQAVVMIHE